MAWLVVQHVPYEGPGLITHALAAHGLAYDVTRVDLGEVLPRDASALDGLVVMGGPMSVHDDLEWLEAERRLIVDALDRAVPVVGICLGAQQLALAAGAEVTTGPSQELGVGSVILTSEGRKDPVFGPEYSGLGTTSIPCLHWHGDTFSLPEGAVHLAASAAYPHQAFRLGSSAYGLQFHVEVDEQLAEAWAPHLPEMHLADRLQVTVAGQRILTRLFGVLA